jgi:cellulose synthase/poly-beta-1,6-N-acetylglucosamine synthase-like glycosyltransferase
LAITIVSIISVLLTFLYALVVMFFRKGWLAIKPFKAVEIIPITKVSVLIAARNEVDKIAFTLDDLMAQNYPKHLLEIIVIDDHSTDKTSEIILKYVHLGVKLIKLDEKEPLNSYKKKAISEAIKIASGTLIITTDADCRMGKNWISTLVNFYEQFDFNLISAPVIYFEEQSLFEKLQTLEFLYLIGLGAAGIGNKMPSTCNGANLAYKKEVFMALDGFKGIDDLASGDDELFLHKVAKAFPNSIGFCKSDDAIVYTHAKSTLAEFISQRKRWASKSVKYKDKKVMFLAVSLWFFNVSLLANLVLGLFYSEFLSLLVMQLTIKIISEFLYLQELTAFAKRKKLIYYLSFLSILHVAYFIYIGLAANSGKYVWKGRLVR